MIIRPNSNIMKGAYVTSPMNGAADMPWMYTSPRDEYLACRRSAWLGVNLNLSPVFDISGPDAAAFLEQTCTNTNFAKMTVGQSKHALVCNEAGHLLADGVIMKKENCYRTYWLAPLIQYYMMKSGLNVTGEYVQDEYFFQIDGPKSLEILEDACQCDLHDIRFAKNKTVRICDSDMTVHRLGMSGALAYEVHGDAKYAEAVYDKICESLFKYDGRRQGAYNYSVVNHTPGGYPNQNMHFYYAYFTSGDADLADFAKKYCMLFPLIGSASVDPVFCEVTPYDIGWGNLVSFKHDFMGKEALMELKDKAPRKPVTLEWNTEDVGDVFMSQFRGQGVEPYDKLDCSTGLDSLETFGVRCDYVQADGKNIGYAAGRCYAYYERRMVSLAFIEPEYAVEGKELIIKWGNPGSPVKDIRATVAQFPYYNGEYRNETFDVENIPRKF